MKVFVQLVIKNADSLDATLRTACIQALLQQQASDDLICLSVESSSVPRPETETGPDLGIIYVPNLPQASKPISVG